MNNPRIKDLQFLNDIIGEEIYAYSKTENSITYYWRTKIENHQHALKLFEIQQEAYRKGVILTFDQTPF